MRLDNSLIHFYDLCYEHLGPYSFHDYFFDATYSGVLCQTRRTNVDQVKAVAVARFSNIQK